MIRVERLSEFKGEDVVLVAFDRDGLDAMRTAFVGTEQEDRPTKVALGGRDMVVEVAPGAARIDLQPSRVVWTLDRTKIDEIVGKLDAMRESARPNHHYVDIDAPVDTLVLAKDEYPRSLQG